jgi:DNA-binding transcriptional ArsR family regulator
MSSMSEVLDLAAVAALVGDPARANILCALLSDRALTASELAYAAHVSPQTASGHLGKLTVAKLISVVAQGRHRYYRLAGSRVAAMLESIMNVAADAPRGYEPRWRHDEALRTARTCYDHFAGRLGVGLADALCERGHVAFSADGGEVTPDGVAFLTGFGLDIADLQRRRRPFCRPCLDWSERRPHLAGTVGAALMRRVFDLDWVKRVRDTRAVAITPLGERGLREVFDLSLRDAATGGKPSERHAVVAAPAI